MTEQEYLDLAQDALGICSDYLVSAENVTTPSGNRPEYDILHVLVNSLAQAIVDHHNEVTG